MDTNLTVEELLYIINQYKEELAIAIEQKMLYKALLNKQIKINNELKCKDEK